MDVVVRNNFSAVPQIALRVAQIILRGRNDDLIRVLLLPAFATRKFPEESRSGGVHAERIERVVATKFVGREGGARVDRQRQNGEPDEGDGFLHGRFE